MPPATAIAAKCRRSNGSAISRPSASMAIMAAPGSTKQPNAGRCRSARSMRVDGRAGLAGARPRRSAGRWRSCACPAFTGRAATRWSIWKTAPQGGWSSPTRCSTASIATTLPARCGISSSGNTGGIFNVTDDEPAPPQDVVTYAASLMGVEPPPEIPFETAQLSPMARSFYGENKRVANTAIKAAGYRFRFPDYRAGLRPYVGERRLARRRGAQPDEALDDRNAARRAWYDSPWSRRSVQMGVHDDFDAILARADGRS